ncbi:MAG: PspA/IM30 family protein, partial [Chloroflexota bacterium]
MSAMSELERMEKRILTDEARADAMQELETDNIEWKFAELEADDDVEAELQALKARVSGDDPKSLSDGDATKSE